MNTHTNTHAVVDYVLNYYLPHLPIQLQEANVADHERLINEDWDESERLGREDTSYDPLQFSNRICGLFIGVNADPFYKAIYAALSGYCANEDDLVYEVCNVIDFFHTVMFPLGEALFSEGFLKRCEEYHLQNTKQEEYRMGDEMPTVGAVMYLREWWLANGGSKDCMLYPEYLTTLESEA
jgi:hypothetical protein